MSIKIEFDIIKNTRPSSYELGEIRCDSCNCQTSTYLEILTEDSFYNICTSCLTLGIKMIQNSFAEDQQYNPTVAEVKV